MDYFYLVRDCNDTLIFVNRKNVKVVHDSDDEEIRFYDREGNEFASIEVDEDFDEKGFLNFLRSITYNSNYEKISDFNVSTNIN